MKRREALATHVVSKRTARSVLPANGICPTSRHYYFECCCDNHPCGMCGRRWSQRSEHGAYHLSKGCQCERNRRRNGFPPHWR